jgi:hypothetical protein
MSVGVCDVPASGGVGFIVMVTTSTLPDSTAGLALLSKPVPIDEAPFELSRMAVLQPFDERFGVVVVAVTLGKGAVAGKSVDAVRPDWKENWIDAMLGIVACQANSPHLTLKPGLHDVVNVCVNVAGWYAGGAGPGGGRSGETHPVRSKNMNSSAFSWASIGAWAHAYGNHPLFSVGPLPVRLVGDRNVPAGFCGR